MWGQRLLSISLCIVLCGFLLSGLSGCSEKPPVSEEVLSERHEFPDTLRVGTLYSPMSYFLYREDPMGYDYELIEQLGADKGIEIELEVATNLNSLIEMLDSGVIDLVAYEIPITGEYQVRVVPCGIERITTQVLVQPRAPSDSMIRDVTDLPGRDVYVEANSKYHHRMVNLNEELGGGVVIHALDRDTLISEDLIEMVSSGEIPLTVVDSDIARLNKTYFKNIDIGLEVSFPQRSSWGVSPSKKWLADSINAWFGGESPKEKQASVLRRYFELSKIDERSGVYHPNLKSGRVSPFDSLFQRYAEPIGWDWRLLASQGFLESRYDSTLVSWAGARGIMQLMPGTAKAYGVRLEDMTDNEISIKTSAKVIESLDQSLSSKIPNKEERSKFIVAAYNSGLAHILDAIALAEKYGLNPQVWEGNVEHALLMKSKPEYYNDPVCKYGYFRGKQTTEYVKNVFAFYKRVKKELMLTDKRGQITGNGG